MTTPIVPYDQLGSATVEEQRAYWLAETTRPVKFEGEQPYVPYFWDAFMSGLAAYDDDDDDVLVFDVDDEDRAIFPELVGRKRVRLLERDDGFVVEMQ